MEKNLHVRITLLVFCYIIYVKTEPRNERKEDSLYKINNFSSLTNKEIEEMMKCSLTDEELYEGDVKICNPDYQYDDILPEDYALISDRLELKDSTLLINAVTLSISTTSGLYKQLNQSNC